MKAYSGSRSDRVTAEGHKTLGNKLMLGPLSFKLRAFLAKQVSQEFMHSFLGLITPRYRLFMHRAAPPSGIVSGLNQVGDVGSQEIRRLFTDRMKTWAVTKPRGEGPSPLFHSPLSPSLVASS